MGETCSDLLGARGGENGACDACCEETLADVADEGGLVAGAAAADEGDVGGRGSGEGGGVAIDNLVKLVEDDGGVSQG